MTFRTRRRRLNCETANFGLWLIAHCSPHSLREVFASYGTLCLEYTPNGCVPPTCDIEAGYIVKKHFERRDFYFDVSLFVFTFYFCHEDEWHDLTLLDTKET